MPTLETRIAADAISQTATRNDYSDAERRFLHLMRLKNLDQQMLANPEPMQAVNAAIDRAITEAYKTDLPSSQAHRFLQRVLYRINRLKLFWYDDLSHYDNEGSTQLAAIRLRIENAWQQWERRHLDIPALKKENVEAALRKRAQADLAPEPSETDLYFRDRLSEKGYRRLLAIASLDGLVEASQLSRVIGGVGNAVQSMLTRLLIEEYGAGRLERKHSSFFTAMLDSLGMRTEPEAYFERVPWEVLATINHSFYLCERKRHFLRYVGGLLHTEISVPAAFENYRLAAIRLNLPEKARKYWELHIKVDKRHGRWMLEEVALPLIAAYEDAAWEMILGYDQQKFMGTRAARSVVRSTLQADRE